VERHGAYSSLLLQRLGERAELSSRDLALATELVYGVLRRRLYLDHVIATFCSRPLGAIEADLVLILRLALYQVLFLDRIPDHAAVSEAVAMARSHAALAADAHASFVNGLLRAVTRDRSRVPAPGTLAQSGQSPEAALAVAESHPEWLVRRWIARLGLDQAARLMAAHNRPAPITLRVNLMKGSPQQVAASLADDSILTTPCRFLDEFLRVTGGAPQLTAAFRRGEFYIQDEASGLVARMAGARPADQILDACAAPGGKALALAEKVGERGLVVAADLHPARLGLVRDNARRLEIPWCVTLAADLASNGPPLREAVSFDIVMVDAPCSGTGVIRRDPELRYRLTAAALHRLAALQRSLLERCAPLVRDGGALIYAVCSIEPEEGPDQIEWFLSENPDFTLEDPRGTLPVQAGPLVAVGRSGPCLMTLPHRDDLDGFFAARLVRRRPKKERQRSRAAFQEVNPRASG
jgi:16S rRNA (cytosine967-C5)-methyltransferase